MKKILASVVMAMIAVAVMSSQALAGVVLWTPDQFEAKDFEKDRAAYTLIYDQDGEGMFLQGPMLGHGSGSGGLDVWHRGLETTIFNGTEYVYGGEWVRLSGWDYKCSYENGRFTCEIAVDDSDFEQVVEIAVAVQRNGTPIEYLSHSPSFLISEHMTVVEAGAVAACLIFGDSDCDNDDKENPSDNCMVSGNKDQVDSDEDGRGDICDSDDDNDGIVDALDTCQGVFNPLNKDSDIDGIGDACDPVDPDAWRPNSVQATGDFGSNWSNYALYADGSPLVIKVEGYLPKAEGDLIVLYRSNKDGLPGRWDLSINRFESSCVTIPSMNRFGCTLNFSSGDQLNDVIEIVVVDNKAEPGQAWTPDWALSNRPHSPSLLVSEAITKERYLAEGVRTTSPDSDTDRDGVRNSEDNCPSVPNPDQKNTDRVYGDIRGNACDADVDHDGVKNLTIDGSKINYIDNCLFRFNPDQKDIDGDGKGDVCDPTDDREPGQHSPVHEFDPATAGNVDIERADVDAVTFRPADPDPDPDPCESNPDADECKEPENNDRDGDGVLNEEDSCPDVPGVFDGCPDVPFTPDPALPLVDGDDEGGFSASGSTQGDGGWGCSLGGSTAANPATFLLMVLALMPMVIRRKRK